MQKKSITFFKYVSNYPEKFLPFIYEFSCFRYICFYIYSQDFFFSQANFLFKLKKHIKKYYKII